MDYSRSGGVSEKCLELGFFLRGETIGFVDGLNVRCEGRRRI